MRLRCLIFLGAFSAWSVHAQMTEEEEARLQAITADFAELQQTGQMNEIETRLLQEQELSEGRSAEYQAALWLGLGNIWETASKEEARLAYEKVLELSADPLRVTAAAMNYLNGPAGEGLPQIEVERFIGSVLASEADSIAPYLDIHLRGRLALEQHRTGRRGAANAQLNAMYAQYGPDDELALFFKESALTYEDPHERYAELAATLDLFPQKANDEVYVGLMATTAEEFDIELAMSHFEDFLKRFPYSERRTVYSLKVAKDTLYRRNDPRLAHKHLVVLLREACGGPNPDPILCQDIRESLGRAEQSLRAQGITDFERIPVAPSRVIRMDELEAQADILPETMPAGTQAQDDSRLDVGLLLTGGLAAVVIAVILISATRLRKRPH